MYIAAASQMSFEPYLHVLKATNNMMTGEYPIHLRSQTLPG